VLDRLEHEGDPWRDMARHGQTLTQAQRRLSGALAERGLRAGEVA
jgi:hypothetical protein